MRVGEAAAQVDAAAIDFRRQSVLDRVLHQRLQQHAGDHDVERRSFEFLHHAQLVATEADDFNVEIVVDEFHFFTQRHKSIAAVEQAAQNVGQLDDQFTGRIGIEAHQRGDRIQRIKEEVRIDLVLQRLHAGVQQQPLLLFQLDLNANAVPDFEFRPDDSDRSGVDQKLHPPGRALQAESATGRKTRKLGLHKAQRHDGDEKHGLPFERVRRGQVAPDPAIDAEVHERGERPDVFAIGSEDAQLPGDEAAQHVKGQGRPFAMPDRRKCQQNAAQHAGEPAADHAQQHRGLERQIAGHKTPGAEADPDAQGQGNADPQHQIDFLLPGPLIAEKQRLELDRAPQNAGG